MTDTSRRARALPALALPLALAALALGGAPAAHGQGRPPERVVLITGSTDGLGREVALGLARPGTHILVHGRNRERGEAVVKAIEAAGGTARFYAYDLADLGQVRALADAVTRDHERLDVLVNNAGILLEGDRRVSADGHELHFAVNYLSHFLLTRRLLPLLRAAAPSRIVNVASGSQAPLDLDDVMITRRYSEGRAYAQSKLAQIMFTFDLAAELEGSGVSVNALHPATLMNTNMILSRGVRPLSSVEEGAAAVLHAVEAAEPGSGRYFDGVRPGQVHPQALDEAARARLRRLSEELTAGR